jgi:UPF0755 protein
MPRMTMRSLSSAPTRAHARLRLVGVFLSITLLLLLAGCRSEPALSAYLDSHKQQLNRPAASAEGGPREFVVEPGMTSRAIAQRLQSTGLIDDAFLFEAYVRVNGLGNRLQAGTYKLSPEMTPVQIADALQHAQAASITISIPEGWRIEQIADYLNANGLLDGTEYKRLALSGAEGVPPGTTYSFSNALPAGASLEGYLFPATYQLPREGATAADLIRRQLDTFAERVPPLYQDAVSKGTTKQRLREVLTLASIVDREAVVDEERPVIAGVYLNRLAQGMMLQADPTVQYAMGYQPDTGQWWKTPVSLDEYAQVLSPYNTYLHEGLPPGPIANPSLASIKAVLNPAQHDYLYFVAVGDGTGRHVFARTYAEHEQNVARYMSRQP